MRSWKSFIKLLSYFLVYNIQLQMFIFQKCVKFDWLWMNGFFLLIAPFKVWLIVWFPSLRSIRAWKLKMEFLVKRNLGWMEIILDPRLKMKLPNYFFPLMYSSENTNQLNKVTKLLEDWFLNINLGKRGLLLFPLHLQ